MLAADSAGPGIPSLPGGGDPNSPPVESAVNALTGSPDPHLWLDPLLAMKELQKICDVLMKRDPANATQYFTNESHYEEQLRDLDDEIGQATVDLQRRRLFCAGSAFSYFLSRYEFTVAGEENPPAAGWDAASAANIVKEAEAKGAQGIIAAAGPGAGLLNGKGLPVVLADPMENGPASTDYYVAVTRANVQALRKALAQ